MYSENLNKSVRKFGYKNYEDYLQSDKWKNFRETYKNSLREQHCLSCGNSNFNLHHVTYKRICREELDDVIPLCTECHEQEHQKKYQDRIKYIPPISFEKAKKLLKKKPKKKKVIPPKKEKWKIRTEPYICQGCGGEVPPYSGFRKCRKCRGFKAS